jgi:hypothetical protein
MPPRRLRWDSFSEVQTPLYKCSDTVPFSNALYFQVHAQGRKQWMTPRFNSYIQVGVKSVPQKRPGMGELRKRIVRKLEF